MPKDSETNANPQRKLTTIFAADVVGFSRMMGENEDATHNILGKSRAIIDRNIENYGGRIFNTAGDSVMAEFGSTVQAVRCALEIQEELAARNAGKPTEEQMWFRIGLNMGDVIIDNDDLIGDSVNVAARMESIAEPGGICISGGVYELVHKKLSFAFQDMGKQSVKNIAQPVPAYGLMPAAAPQMIPNPATVSVQQKSKERRIGATVILVALVAGVATAGTYFILKQEPKQVAETKTPKKAVSVAKVAPVVKPKVVQALIPEVKPSPRPAPVTKPTTPKSAKVAIAPKPAPQIQAPASQVVAKKAPVAALKAPEPKLRSDQPAYYIGKEVEGVSVRRQERFVIKLAEQGSAEVIVHRREKPTQVRTRDNGRWWINKKDRICFEFKRFGQGRVMCRIHSVEKDREWLVHPKAGVLKWALNPG